MPTCVSALNGTDTSCIPYNLFQGGLPGDQGVQGVLDGGQGAKITLLMLLILMVMASKQPLLHS